MKITVGVFFGGCSVEHEVSVISGLQAFAALDRNKYEPVPVYQSKDGLFYTGEKLGNIETFRNLKKAIASADCVDLVREDGKVWLRKRGVFGKKVCALDVAMPVYHGTGGEDGSFQGLMEQLKLPYTGCGVGASALGMDKYMCKAAFRLAGVPCLDCVKITRAEYYADPQATIEKAAEKIGYPMIVKPYNLGSSVGIGKGSDEQSLRDALENALTYTDGALCERCITNLREINCSVIGDSDEAIPSVCEEPHGGKDFLSYADKYQRGGGSKGTKGGSKGSQGMQSLARVVPAPISDELTAKVKETAKQAFLAIGGEGISRIDLMIDGDSGELYVNEINTIPGSLSFYLWEHCGVSFTQLLDKLIELAFKRQRKQSELLSSFDTNLLETASFGGGAKGAKGGSKV